MSMHSDCYGYAVRVVRGVDRAVKFRTTPKLLPIQDTP